MGEVVEFRAPQPGELMEVSLDEMFSVLMGKATLHDVAWNRRHNQIMAELDAMDIPTLRRLWDEVGEDSFYTGPEGSYDCADIHLALNLKGDGLYCCI